MFSKIVTFIIGFVIFLVGGAQLEKMFPRQPVTEVWTIFFLILFFVYLYRWAFKTDKKRATKLLSESGFYSNEAINSMSYLELLTRERSHKKDKTVNWSTYGFEQLLNIEAQEKAQRKLENAGGGLIPRIIGIAYSISEGFYGTSGRRIVCINCGGRMSKHIGIWSNSADCRNLGKKCVPYEAPNI